jgi:hypothetical protein
MLTQTVRQMERDGLITRTVHPVVPPKVEDKLAKGFGRVGHRRVTLSHVSCAPSSVGSRTGAECSLGSAYPLLPVSSGSASLTEP